MTLTAKLNQKSKAILIRELGLVDYARLIQQVVSLEKPRIHVVG